VSGELTGFQHNGVSPFGMARSIPVRSRSRWELTGYMPTDVFALRQVIVAGDAAALPFIWLGGGAETVKLRISVQQLVQALDAKVAPGITTLRTDL
jgi:prolyl-tRNA editing enzyme YbaK/EbsC (Cys-tRNA(Pro) deacylase)